MGVINLHATLQWPPYVRAAPALAQQTSGVATPVAAVQAAAAAVVAINSDSVTAKNKTKKSTGTQCARVSKLLIVAAVVAFVLCNE